MDLSIVVVNFNGKTLLERLLPSIRTYVLENSAFDAEVVVVDNASTDGSRTFLQAQKDIKTLLSETNGGFAYGNNIALKNLNSRYVLLLNSDTELTEQSADLASLLRFMDANPNVGIVSPWVALSNGELDNACHRGEPTPWASFCYLSGLERLIDSNAFSRKLLGSFFGKYHLISLSTNTIHPIKACTGAAMLVRISALQKVGLLDEHFFMYAEDLDWCKRFRDAGYAVMFHPGFRIVHHKYRSGLESTSTEVSKTTRNYFYTSMLQYFDKHYAATYPNWMRRILRSFIERKIAA